MQNFTVLGNIDSYEQEEDTCIRTPLCITRVVKGQVSHDLNYFLATLCLEIRHSFFSYKFYSPFGCIA